jgi:predicted phosphoribosyltransferase
MENRGLYASREAAGKILAEYLLKLNLNKPVILAIPRGGVQVAEGISEILKKPIYPLIVKKLPVPGNPELGFGAITQDGNKVLNEEFVKDIGLDEEIIKTISMDVIREIVRRSEAYGVLKKENLESSDVIIVDDGAATGYSLIAGIKSLMSMNPETITVAVPVASKEAAKKLSLMADNFICPIVDDTYFFAVANYYKEWYDLDETDIANLLKSSAKYI